jgi:hypothetical protein
MLQDEIDMNSQDTAVAGRKNVRVKKAGAARKKKTGVGIRVQKVVAALFLLSFFVFTLGVVGYVIFFGGVQA